MRKLSLLFVLSILTAGFAAAPATATSPPINDGPLNATPFSPSGGALFDTVDITGATVQPGEPRGACGGGPIGHTVWYRTTATDELRRTTRITADFAAAVNVYTGAFGDLTLIGCAHAGDPWLRFRASAGQTVWIQVGGIRDAAGVVNFVVGAPFSGDEFFFARPIELHREEYFGLSGSLEEGEPQPMCAQPMEKSVWYRWTATSARLVTAGFALQAPKVIQAYTGPSSATEFGQIIPFACDSNLSEWFDASVQFLSVPGQTYFFQLGEWVNPDGFVFGYDAVFYLSDNTP